MGAPVPILSDILAEKLHRLVSREINGRVACRSLAFGNVLDGMSREDAAGRAGVEPARAALLGPIAQTLDPSALKRITQSRSVWRSMPGKLAALKALLLRGLDRSGMA